MIRYECCSNVDPDSIYKAFQVGFSDYIIKIEMAKELFLKRFFDIESNQLAHSFIAFDHDAPIGLILGGVKVYEGIKTLRCGTLCVHPDYRGKSISKALFELHRRTAETNHCKQMFLEVIESNDRAINFYKGFGYETVYNLHYYTYQAHQDTSKELQQPRRVQRISFEAITALIKELKDVHINWQNDLDYMEKIEELVHYGVYSELELIGALSIEMNGNIHCIYTIPSERHKGIARAMIQQALKELSLNKLRISFPNNANLAGFVKHINFKKDEIAQYEMYLTL